MNTKPKEPSPEDFDISTEEWEVIKKSKEKDLDSGSKVGCGAHIAGIGCAVVAIYLGNPGFAIFAYLTGTFYTWLLTVLSSGPKLPQNTKIKYDKYTEAKQKYASDLYRYNKRRKNWWFSLSGHDFEAEFGKLLKEQGYTVKPTKGSGDGGIDLYAYENDKEIIIQCKAWKNEVGPGPVRELQGVREPNQDAWFVGLGGFTSGAREFAEAKGIKLFEYRDVLKLVAED